MQLPRLESTFSGRNQITEMWGIRLIDIMADDPVILIKPIDDRSLQDAAMLYNSGNDIRYATGMDGFVPISEVKSRLGYTGSEDKSFASGIYLKSVRGGDGKTDISFAGMVSGTVLGHVLWIRQLSILPACRRKGTGSRAVQLVIRCLRQELQISEVYVSVLGENIPGLRFWEKLSFAEINRVEKELFSDNQKYNVIIMRKTLQ